MENRERQLIKAHADENALLFERSAALRKRSSECIRRLKALKSLMDNLIHPKETYDGKPLASR